MSLVQFSEEFEADMGGTSSKDPDEENKYIGCDRPLSGGEASAKLIFKFKNLTPEVANGADVAFPSTKEDKLVVKINGELLWNNKVYGEVDADRCEVEKKPGKSGCVVVKLAKKNNNKDDWPLQKWSSG